jgi:hypothetical protein
MIRALRVNIKPYDTFGIVTGIREEDGMEVDVAMDKNAARGIGDALAYDHDVVEFELTDATMVLAVRDPGEREIPLDTRVDLW